MLQLLFAVAFSAAPLTLYVPPIRSFSLFVETVETFLREAIHHTARVYPRIRHGYFRIISSIRRSRQP